MDHLRLLHTHMHIQIYPAGASLLLDMFNVGTQIEAIIGIKAL